MMSPIACIQCTKLVHLCVVYVWYRYDAINDPYVKRSRRCAAAAAAATAAAAAAAAAANNASASSQSGLRHALNLSRNPQMSTSTVDRRRSGYQCSDLPQPALPLMRQAFVAKEEHAAFRYLLQVRNRTRAM